jgi:hypothetical protein
MSASTSLPPLLVAMSGRKPRLRRARVPVPKEIKLHVPVAKLLKDHCLPEWRWTHINRKAKDAREGAIFRTMGVKAGWPDFLLISPYGSIRFLELKRVGEEPSDAQKEFRSWCLRHGVPHEIVWTIDQALAALDSWKCLRIVLAKTGGSGEVRT